MLAVLYAAKYFHLYLYGEKFTITTDHRPLLGIVKSLKPATARIKRWRLCHMPYRYSLIYQPRKNDLNPADYLSHHLRHKDNTAKAYISYAFFGLLSSSL